MATCVQRQLFGISATDPRTFVAVAVLLLAASLAAVAALAAYDSSTCAIVSGAVKCRGADNYGELGNSRVIRDLVPTIVVRNDALFTFGFQFY